MKSRKLPYEVMKIKEQKSWATPNCSRICKYKIKIREQICSSIATRIQRNSITTTYVLEKIN